MSERDVVLEKAHEWLDDNCLAKRVKQYDACRLADFALEQIQAERKRIAAELREMDSDRYFSSEGLRNAHDQYIKELEAK